MTRCPSGHFYDASKGSCPTCARLGQAPPPTKPAPTPMAGGPPPRTAPFPGAPPRPAAGTAPRTTPAPSSPAGVVTKPLWPQELGTDPVVGWLVAYQGKALGRDFRLRSGRMRIGRGDDQDVQIDDEHISRQDHAFIVFDPMNCEFLLQPGDGRGLVYLSKNKQKPELVAEPKKLNAYDIIILGKTSLFFVPFCGPNTFQWQPKGGSEPSGWNPGGQGPTTDVDNSTVDPFKTGSGDEW